jgi:hypothetical protein
MTKALELAELGNYTTVNVAGNTVTWASNTVFGNTGVTAGTYGNGTSVSTITVTVDGRITSASNTALTAANSTVAGVVTLTDSITNTSSTIAASANAVKSAVDSAATTSSTNAGTAYANAINYADTKAGTAYSNAISVANTNASALAANAYANAVSYADAKAANAYANVFNGGTFTGNVIFTSNVTANTVRLNGNMQIDGDLIVSGNTVTMNVSSLSVEDNMIYLNASSNVANPDLGIAGNYNDGTYRHAGIFRDATDGVWKFFHQYEPEPDASAYIDTSNNTFALANVQANTFIGAGSFTTVSANGLFTLTDSLRIGNSTVNSIFTSTSINTNGTITANTIVVGNVEQTQTNLNVDPAGTAFLNALIYG